MAQTEGQRRASDAVAAEMSKRGWNNADLIAEVRRQLDETIDPGTVGDFLNGERWPKIGTQGKIERVLGWTPGSIRSLASGAPPQVVSSGVGTDRTGPVGAGVDPGLLVDGEAVSPEEMRRVEDFIRGIRSGG